MKAEELKKFLKRWDISGFIVDYLGLKNPNDKNIEKLCIKYGITDDELIEICVIVRDIMDIMRKEVKKKGGGSP